MQTTAQWSSVLHHDPLPALLSSENPDIAFFAARDLLGKKEGNPAFLTNLPEAQKIIKRQRHDGSWKYPGSNKKMRTEENYDQLETFRNLGYLIEMFGLDRSNPVIKDAAEFLFHFQSKEGDIRGILGNQYTPYYTAAILELLLKAGYESDKRVEKVFGWLSSIRQDDGGWVIPFRTLKKKLSIIITEKRTLEPDRSKPSSSMVTGIVLRAYAASKKHRNSPEARTAGKLLLSGMYKRDPYPDRSGQEMWFKFSFPFWFTDVISAMDSLSLLGFSKEEPQMKKAIEWFVSHQQRNGLWKLKTIRNKQIYHSELWLSLAICRILKRLYD